MGHSAPRRPRGTPGNRTRDDTGRIWWDGTRVRLADVDGAGPADLIYVGPDRVRWWSNQSGNSFAAVANEPPLPGVADPITVSVADLRGDGTACLVWASPLGRDRHNPRRYPRLMSAGKPYLLQSVDNGYGRTTTLQYTPSTAFYLADRRALTPWATRLPFPVQCLSTVTVQDRVTGLSVVSTYAYHHGFFDGVEREFRGFGKVEQWDAEAAPGVTTDQLPPVRTVSWFHTGAWEKDSKLFETYAAEYFGGDPDAFDRIPCTFGTSGPALREAYRALKGRPLRVEVYAEDGGSTVPYVVTETAWNVVQVQAPANTAFGVFRVDPRQTLTAHYERSATDPRVQQELPLDIDAFGVVTRAASVLYPRRGTGHDVQQARGIVLVTRNEVLHDDTPARWHIGLPVRTRAWELAPEDLALFAARLTADDVRSRLPAVAGGSATTAVLDWDEVPPSSGAWLRALADTLTTYDDDGAEAPVGTLGERALVWQRYQRVYTPTQVTDLDDRLDALGVTQTLLDQGYIDLSTVLDDADGLWARSGTQTRDADHFYVPLVFTDPWGAETTLTWHPSRLVPASVVDDLGNTVAATYDTRSMQPVSITDPNGNVTLAVYDALGRVLRIARTGKDGEGDTLDDPTEEVSYDLSTVPVSILHRKRETHADPDSRWIEARAYSDGAGNVVMQKVTAAKVDGVARWIGSGRVVLNNKGLPVKQYEPFFADNDDFEAEEGFGGVTPVLTYDPLGRAIRVDLPNGTLRRVSFGPWNQVTWDENDTIDESTADSGLKASVPASHKNTPTTVALDVQGRVYKTAELVDVAEDAFVTTLTLDVLGNPRVVRDARGIDIQTQAFDLLGRPIFTHSPDGGDVTAVLDAGGAPRWLFKDGDLAIEVELDSLRRPVRTWEWNTSTPQKWLRERLVYGEATNVDQGLGRIYRIYDGAGAVEHAYDWKGNATTLTRRFLADEEAEGDWTAHDGGAYPFTEDTSTVVDDLETSAVGELESETFPTESTYDALNRVVTSESPDGQVVTNTFNEGGQLQTVANGADVVVSAITYNARSQRLSIAYANGATTTYTYEAETFRLATLVTVGDPGTLQDLRYTYDPVGNIVALENAAEDDLYYDNTVVSPDQAFAYDAIYRLTSATGREKGDRVQPWSDDPTFLGLPNTEALRSYTEDYAYDAVGNFASMTHKTGTTTLWTRSYTTAATSNRLESTTEASGTKTYVHDARGNMVYLPHLRFSGTLDPNVVPSFRDQMRKALLPTSGHEAFYAYDAGGQRVRKVVKAGTHTERRYVGNWEIWREYDGSGNVDEARSTLHVVDDTSRVLMVETKTVTAGVNVTEDPVLRYQLGNHLGSVAVELDDDGGLISYEEFHPYGSTAWWAGDSALVSQKRYRYTGMERDEETGLQCHGVRYYAHWIGRWTTADPIGLVDGINRFSYCRDCPTDLADASGTTSGDVSIGASVVGQGETWQQNLTRTISAHYGLDLDASQGFVDALGSSDVKTAGFEAGVSFPWTVSASDNAFLNDLARVRGNRYVAIDDSAGFGAGPLEGAFSQAWGATSDPSESAGVRAVMGSLGALVAPAAAMELIARGFLNIPHDAKLAGQYSGRASQETGMQAANDLSQGILHGTSASVNALTLGSGGAALASSAITTRSGWALGASPRGFKVGESLGENLPKTFPKVDRASDGLLSDGSIARATSIKSLDTAASSYGRPGAVLSRIRSYVNSLANLKQSVVDAGGAKTLARSGVRVTISSSTELALDVAVRPDLSLAQIKELVQGFLYARRMGISMRVVPWL